MATKTLSTQQLLDKWRKEIDQQLADFFRTQEVTWRPDISRYGEEALDLLTEFSLRPGKRIRGSLARFSYNQLAPSPQQLTGLQLAVCLELIQNYLLIIDDVMDKSETRRGKPTVHTMLQQGSDEFLSNMLAVNVGLLGQHLASMVLAGLSEPAQRVQRATLVLHRNIALTCFGQIDDMHAAAEHDMGEEDILRVYRAKSSYYTFVNPLQLGACIAGITDQRQLRSIQDFGIPAGIAFQLQDDILGMFGDSNATGKSTADDLREGKHTLLMHYALQMASRSQVVVLRSALGNPLLSKVEIKNAQSIVESCGARQRVVDTAEAMLETAREALRSTELWDTDGALFLHGILDFITVRKN